MKKDIKMLETQIQACKECKFATCEQCEISYTEVKAIENLISRNKKLEQENKILKNKQTKIIADSFHEKMAKKFDDDFIKKSKIKAKIEELQNEILKRILKAGDK